MSLAQRMSTDELSALMHWEVYDDAAVMVYESEIKIIDEGTGLVSCEVQCMTINTKCKSYSTS